MFCSFKQREGTRVMTQPNLRKKLIKIAQIIEKRRRKQPLFPQPSSPFPSHPPIPQS